jgi:CRISPR-associated endonuclease/helicase Cas3
MTPIELQFPVLGPALPAQHGYDLYAALCRLLPQLHEPDCIWQVGPIFGLPAGGGALRLDARRSRLRLRLPAEDIPCALPLAGQALDVAGLRVRLGAPQVRALDAVPILGAKLVALKVHGTDAPTPEAFLAAVRRQFVGRGIHGEAGIPLARQGPHAGRPRRGVLRLKGRRIVGYALLVQGLTAHESLALQERGVGGRRRMGCGFFVPVGLEA